MSAPAFAEPDDFDRSAAPHLRPVDDSFAVQEPAEAPADPDANFEDLVVAALGGGPGGPGGRARDQLLARILPMVLRYCRSRLGRQETALGSAEDVAQEICMAVVTALPNYQLKGLSFRAFVYGIAAHKVTDAYRAIGRNKCDPVPEMPDTQTLLDGPEERLLDAERALQLNGLMDCLTRRQREVLVLRLGVGLSAEETAVLIGSTPGAVRVTQHRALNRLRNELSGPTDPNDPDDRDGR